MTDETEPERPPTEPEPPLAQPAQGDDTGGYEPLPVEPETKGLDNPGSGWLRRSSD